MCPSHVLVHRSNSCIGIVPHKFRILFTHQANNRRRVDENDRGDGCIGMLGGGCIRCLTFFWQMDSTWKAGVYSTTFTFFSGHVLNLKIPFFLGRREQFTWGPKPPWLVLICLLGSTWHPEGVTPLWQVLLNLWDRSKNRIEKQESGLTTTWAVTDWLTKFWPWGETRERWTHHYMGSYRLISKNLPPSNSVTACDRKVPGSSRGLLALHRRG